jgi:hypothetical protein
MFTNIEASEISFVISFIVSLLLSFGFYLKDKNMSETASLIKYILIASRFFVLFIILFLLFNPLFISKREISNSPNLVCLVDNSESMLLSDSLVSKNIENKLKSLKERVQGKSNVEIFSFGNELFKSDTANFQGKKTDLLDAISKLSEIEQNKNISGLVILTDGIITSGGIELFNPMNVPVYSIGMGDTVQIKDAMVNKVYHNDITYTGNYFPVEINCILKKMKGIRQSLSLKFEDKLLLDTSFIPVSDNYIFKALKLLKADNPGMRKIEVILKNNISEKILNNNKMQRFVNVLDSKQKIAFVYDAPHPDIRALKNVFYGDISFSIEEFKFNDSCPNISQYNAIVFVGNSNAVTSSRWREECIKGKVSSLWLTGVNSSFNSKHIALNRLDNSEDEAYLSLEKGFTLFKLNDEMKDFLQKSPPLSIPFGKWRIANVSQTLATQNIGGVSTNYPLITFSSENNIKSAYILGEGIWRWKLQEEGNLNHFDDFFKKVIQYLSVKKDKSSFRLKYDKIVSNNEKVIIESEYYNPSYELENSGSLKLQIKDANGEKFDYEFLKVGKKYRIDLGVLNEGVYNLRAIKTVGDKKIEKKGKLIVEGKSLESLNLQADYSQLKKLSKLSFGKFYYKNQFKVFLDDISNEENFKTLTYTESVREQLLKNKWILFLLITLLGVEWFVRKWEGVI